MNPTMPDPLRSPTVHLPRRSTSRRVLVAMVCGISSLLGVAAVAVLCWTVSTAAAQPDRLVTDAPRPVSTSMAGLTSVLVAVFLHIPARRV